MSLVLVPETLPVIDIITLAQSGQIVRAERFTAEDSVPAFITQTDWEILKNHPPGKKHTSGNNQPPLSDESLLIALEKTSAYFLQKVAQALMSQKKDTSTEVQKSPYLFEIESDLFSHQTKSYLLLAKDKTYPIACALLGTSQSFLESLILH